MISSLQNRTAIITGASQGLGLVISHAYVTAGANVCMCGRNRNILDDAVKSVNKLAKNGQKIFGIEADVSNKSDVETLVDRAIKEFSQVHILVNNAGIYGPIGFSETVDWDDWVKAIEVNLLGSVLMCRHLLPHLKLNHYGKIIQLSGGGATSPLPRFSAYAASKAAVIRYMETLSEEVKLDRIDVNAIAPGALNTRLLDEALKAGPEKVGEAFYERLNKVKSQGGDSLEEASRLAVFLGSAASDGITGKLISAVWDPWERLSEHLSNLQNTDIYTLRRILPEDRGLDWGG